MQRLTGPQIIEPAHWKDNDKRRMTDYLPTRENTASVGLLIEDPKSFDLLCVISKSSNFYFSNDFRTKSLSFSLPSPIFRASKLWKAKFSILCDLIFLLRLQENFLELITLWNERVERGVRVDRECWTAPSHPFVWLRRIRNKAFKFWNPYMREPHIGQAFR